MQWYTGTTGYIKSYNYDEGVHLANQQYSACIRCNFFSSILLSYFF